MNRTVIVILALLLAAIGMWYVRFRLVPDVNQRLTPSALPSSQTVTLDENAPPADVLPSDQDAFYYEIGKRARDAIRQQQ